MSNTDYLLVLGTHNLKKRIELVELLSPFGFQLRSLADYPQSLNVDEVGTTFAENAALKATRQSRHLGTWVMAEDSGLAVDALNGAPGIFSARYSGPAASDESNNLRLLEELAATQSTDRSAHYVCHVALADPHGKVRAACEACCYGRIRPEPAGAGGFGYDPLFEIREYHRTFGQLGAEVKSVLSHRARAMRMMVPRLIELSKGAWNCNGVAG